MMRLRWNKASPRGYQIAAVAASNRQFAGRIRLQRGTIGEMTSLRWPGKKTPDVERLMQPKVEWPSRRPGGETAPSVLRGTTAIGTAPEISTILGKSLP
jgi:hypothetical protein